MAAKTILNDKRTARIIAIPDFKLYFVDTAIKQHGTGRKTDTSMKSIEFRTQI